MIIGMDEWRDGIGYDLEALANVTDSERDELVKMLGERLRSNPDWREVESLGVIGTPAAKAVLRASAKLVGRETRLSIEKQLAALEEPADVEGAIVDALRNTRLFGGLSKALDMAEHSPSPRIRETLLDLALNGQDEEQRVHCAALALYLGGKAAEAFDWNHRPLFLRFGESDRAVVIEAYKELCARLGVEPKGI
ncbi:MAG: hypothetical protein ACRD8O_16580 [Bryobacteraceae bacterium]